MKLTSLGSLNSDQGVQVVLEEITKFAPGAEEPWEWMTQVLEQPERRLAREVIVRAWHDATLPHIDSQIKDEARRWFLSPGSGEDGDLFFYLNLLNLSDDYIQILVATLTTELNKNISKDKGDII